MTSEASCGSAALHDEPYFHRRVITEFAGIIAAAMTAASSAGKRALTQASR